MVNQQPQNNQLWTLVPLPSMPGYYRLQNAGTSNYVKSDASGNLFLSPTPTAGSSAQYEVWSMGPNNTLVNYGTSKVIDINGSTITSNTSSGAASQNWTQYNHALY